jgi:hypothetical protein
MAMLDNGAVNISAATDADATIEDAVFSVRSVLRLYNGDQLATVNNVLLPYNKENQK